MDERIARHERERTGTPASRKGRAVTDRRAVHISGGSRRITKMGERGRRERARGVVDGREEKARKRCGVAPLLSPSSLFSPSAGLGFLAYSPTAASAGKLLFDPYGYPAVTRTVSPRAVSV
jgi:hypothetical protein